MSRMAQTGPAAEPIQTARLILEPLTVAHATEMAGVLAAPGLYAFTGGQPPTLPELTERYRRWAAGPPARDRAGWLNWVIRQREDQRLAGTVQATIGADPGGLRAEIAWVVGAAWQGRGYAAESARALVGWLRGHQVVTITAAIHPGNAASAAVARRAGLVPTAERADGEVVWRLAG
jgi:RimJ/RimL family protein N-acetyltransferase